MRKLAAAAAVSLIITLTGCGGSNKTATPTQPPAFTPSSSKPPAITPDTRLIDAINPCALVTLADLTEITHRQYFPMGETPVIDQSTHEHSCHYGSPEPSLRVTTLLDAKKDGAVWRSLIKGHSLTHKVDNIGDEAFRGGDVLLVARSGRMIISFERAVPDASRPSDGQLTALAKRAVSRFAASS